MKTVGSGVKLQYTDGGRSQSSYYDEKLDCTVRAYALAAGLNYSESHKLFESVMGRKFRNRCSFNGFMQKHRPEVTHISYDKPRKRLCTLLKGKTFKTAVLRISGHVFCVRENIVLDMWSNKNSIVLDAWIFE